VARRQGVGTGDRELTGAPHDATRIGAPTGSSRSRILGGGGPGGRRGAALATVSTIIFFGLVVTAVVNSPGWAEIESSFFDRATFTDSLPGIARKFGWNIFIFCVAEALVLVLALFVAVLRGLPGPLFAPLRLAAIGYTDLFRGVPTILVISLLGFGMPALQLQGVPRSDLFWGIMSLVLVYAAYVAEVYRAGIESIHPSQVAAARSLGLSRWLALRHVVLPQAVRRVIPPLLNDFIGLQKDSALVAFLGFVEGLQQANLDSAATFNFTPYVALALVYLVITVPMTRFVDHLLLRERRRRETVA
jgi:polar amino acid transport system permease protein